MRPSSIVTKASPQSFEKGIWEILDARGPERGRGDLGIDGWLKDDRPLQVKQQVNVARPVVDMFETAIRRDGNHRGVIVAFSASAGAREEVRRVRRDEGLSVHSKTVEKLLMER